MANDVLTPSIDAWSRPKFSFQVKWGTHVMFFQEVSGLDVESTPIEYRRGDSPSFSPIQMPGINKYSIVTMKKGIFKSDNKFWDWFNEIKTTTEKRVPVTISLIDEAGNPTMVWTLSNAWPTKIAGTDLKSEGNETAVESIEIAFDGLTVATR
jgi:phage tail-like protein